MQKNIQKLKYLLILPLFLFMAFLSSCMNFEIVKDLEILHDGNALYMVNSFNYSEYEVKVTYSNGKEEILPLTDDMIVDYDALSFYKAGEHTITIEYGRKKASFDIVVTKNTFSDDIVLNKKEVEYTGETFKVEVEGILPAGTKVYYPSGNEFSNAAIYDIKAVLICDGYNLKELSTTLTIKRGRYDLSDIGFNDKSVEYNSGRQSLEVVGDIPNGLSVEYSIREYDEIEPDSEAFTEGNEATNAGIYQVKAEFKNLNNNYYPVEPMIAYLTINPKEYILNGVEFNDASFVYNGKDHQIELVDPNGILRDERIFYLYKCETVDVQDPYSETQRYVGTYDYAVYFYTLDSNYTVKEKMEATLTITPAVIVLDDVYFDGATFEYDEEAHTIYCTSDYYNCPTEMYKMPPAHTTFIGYKRNADDDSLIQNISETNAGKYRYYACFASNDPNYVIDGGGMIEGWLEIKKKTIYLSNIVFEDKTFVYDGKTHSLSYEIIDGANYTFLKPLYSMNNNQTKVGEYVITLKFVSSNPNYEFEEREFKATLSIVEGE